MAAPYVRKNIVERTPIKRGYWLFFGLSGFIAAMFAFWLGVGEIAGAYDAIAWNLAIFGLGGLFFLINSWRATKKGIPIEMIFKEIPPE
jgi:hypothetical protein